MDHIGCPDKGASVVSLATAATTAVAIFANADDHLSIWVENPSQYTQDKLVQEEQSTHSWTKYNKNKVLIY